MLSQKLCINAMLTKNDKLDYKHHESVQCQTGSVSPSSEDYGKSNGIFIQRKRQSSFTSQCRRTRRRFQSFRRSLRKIRIGPVYQIMEEEYHGYLEQNEETEREFIAKKKSRSKSLPNNSLAEAKRQIQYKEKLGHVQQQQQQPLQQLDENQQPRRKSSPLTLPLLQIGKEILSNSAKDIEFEKKRMEYVLEKQKRLQDDSAVKYNRNTRRKSLNIFFGFATDPSGNSEQPALPLSSLAQSPTGEGTFTKWKRKIHRKVSSGKNLRTAEEGHKRATRAMNAAGDWIVQMEDSLQQEEKRLRERALDLRRKSVSAFKLMSDAKRDDLEEEEDDHETDGNKAYDEKLLRFGHDYYFTEPTPMPNDPDYDDTFYDCLAVDEAPFKLMEKEGRVDESQDSATLPNVGVVATLPNDFKFEQSLSEFMQCRRQRSKRDDKASFGPLSGSCGDFLQLSERLQPINLNDSLSSEGLDFSGHTELCKRSSLSTQEEYLWTSDSNPGSDYVIKEDVQETVI